jgi:hypothetical protein
MESWKKEEVLVLVEEEWNKEEKIIKGKEQ